MPTCKDGVSCKNLKKDKNGCPADNFCAATLADCKSRGGKLASRKACPTKLMPTCKDGVSCKNLKKDKNGCPADNFCAATSADCKSRGGKMASRKGHDDGENDEYDTPKDYSISRVHHHKLI